MCSPFVFKNISRLRFKAIRARICAQASQTTQLGDTGTAEGFGIKAQWSYSEADLQLTVTVTDKPFYISENTLRDKMTQLVEGVQV